MTEDGPSVVVGALIDARHRIEGLLGSGGFATVYLGRDIESNQRVAIKVLNGAHRARDRARARFQREIEAVAKLQSPYTVRLVSDGEAADGTPFIIFEHVPGKDIADVLNERGQLDPSVARHIIEQVLQSLKEAHHEGILHRDIKPQNVRIFEHEGDPWTVKVLDFGIARLVDPDNARLTKTGELLGTPRYMSPEQLLSRPLGPASDIYSVGVMALELLLGSDAMHGNRFSDQLERLQTGHLFAPGTEHARLQEVISRMTARDPADRFQSAESVLRALDPPTKPPERAPRRIQDRIEPESPSELEPPQAARDSKFPWPALGLLGVVLCAIAVVVVQRDEAPTSVTQKTLPSGFLRTTTPAPVADVGVGLLPDTASAAASQDNGCGKAVDSGTRQFRVPGSGVLDPSRTFNAYVPNGYDPARPHPVLLLFQTVLFSAAEIMAATRAAELADREQIVVLSFAPRDGLFDEGDIEYVRGALAETDRQLCVDQDRRFVLGHGKGGVIARAIGCRENLTAVATIGDYTTTATGGCSEHPIAYMKLAAKNDQFSPFAGGHNCVGDGPTLAVADVEDGWRKLNGCRGSSKTWARETGGTCSSWTCGEAPFVSCHIDGGHFWPGQSLSLPIPSCEATRNTSFPTMDKVWKFFEQQSPGTRPATDR